MTKGVLFDLDGVVVDSESIYTQFWSDIDKLYPTGVENFAIAIKGNTLQRILADYFPDNDVKQDILERIKDFEINMRYKPFAEAIRFINELKRNQFRIAIVTSSSQKKMDNLYAQNPGFREMFDAVVTGDMVSHSKPDPEPYLLGAEAIGVAPESCYVFEDSISGIESGIRAGATVIGLATTLPYDKIEGKAHLTINDFTGFHVGDMLSVEK
ncbi:MAG: HAD family hydrolase [Bacteroidales bacterium]|nr:HAD family hydrolase [Bacteroidales bacterium]MDD7760066.1 HAD family hydrolase [Bacteroidales bacterium]